MILSIQEALRARVIAAVTSLYGLPASDLPSVPIAYPPHRGMGDLSITLAFELARRLRKAPRVIGQEIAAALGAVPGIVRVECAANGYLNVFLDRTAFLGDRLAGRVDPAAAGAADDKVIVEHTAINPNKAAHIGHLRNAALGDTLVRSLRFLGHPVEIQNYIDDTGVQVADVVVGFRHLERQTLADVEALAGAPRFDYHCWDLYARVTEWYDADKARLSVRADTLHEIERGEGESAAIGRLVADRIVRCHLKTMRRLNVQYDLLTWEGDILRLQFWNKAFERLKAQGTVYFQPAGRLAGCWVMHIEDAAGSPADVDSGSSAEAAGGPIAAAAEVGSSAEAAGGPIAVAAEAGSSAEAAGGPIVEAAEAGSSAEAAGGPIAVAAEVGSSAEAAGGPIVEAAEAGSSAEAAGGPIAVAAEVGSSAEAAGGPIAVAAEVGSSAEAAGGPIAVAAEVGSSAEAAGGPIAAAAEVGSSAEAAGGPIAGDSDLSAEAAGSAEGDAAEADDQAEKVIVRSNGTVTYVGKDMAYQFWKFGLLGEDFHYRLFGAEGKDGPLWATSSVATGDEQAGRPVFGRGHTVYNVIDVRQSYLQKLLKQALAAAGHPGEAERSVHFSYEMVALSHGTARQLGYSSEAEDAGKPFVEVSGRKGLGVKADDLIDTLIAKAEQEVARRNPELPAAEARRTAELIAVSAVRYFMVRFSRGKVIAFDIDEALSFEGESGPYLQYSAVRANNIFQKLRDRDGLDEAAVLEQIAATAPDELASSQDDHGLWALVLEASRLDEVASQAVRSLEFAGLAKWAFGLAQLFNAFYHRYSVLNEERADAKIWRAAAVAYYRRQLTLALDLMGIDVPTRM